MKSLNCFWYLPVLGAFLSLVGSSDASGRGAPMGEKPRQKEWEAFVAKFQQSLPGASSSETWKLMDRIFKLP